MKDERDAAKFESGEAYETNKAAEKKRKDQKAEEKRKKEGFDRKKDEFVQKNFNILDLTQGTSAPIPK